MVLAPDHGIGVLTFSNTGAFNPRGAPVPVANALLDLPEDAVRADVPERPQVWSDLCGWYSFGPGVLLDPQQRALLGAGLEVVVRRDHFTIRGQTPVPAVRKGLRLHPDGDDPYVFRIDVSGFGAGTSPVVFSRGPGGQVTALHIGLMPMSFQKRPDVQNPRPWVNGAIAAPSRRSLSAGVAPPGDNRVRKDNGSCPLRAVVGRPTSDNDLASRSIPVRQSDWARISASANAWRPWADIRSSAWRTRPTRGC